MQVKTKHASSSLHGIAVSYRMMIQNSCITMKDSARDCLAFDEDCKRWSWLISKMLCTSFIQIRWMSLNLYAAKKHDWYAAWLLDQTVMNCALWWVIEVDVSHVFPCSSRLGEAGKFMYFFNGGRLGKLFSKSKSRGLVVSFWIGIVSPFATTLIVPSPPLPMGGLANCSPNMHPTVLPSSCSYAVASSSVFSSVSRYRR